MTVALTETEIEVLVTAILSVNSYPLERVHRILPRMRTAHLLEPRFVSQLDLGPLTVRLYESGYDRGKLTSMFAERLQGLMKSIAAGELEGLGEHVESENAAATMDLLQKVSGIGPRVARTAWLLLLSNHMRISAPPDVHAPPPDAARTEKGVFYKILQRGAGPKPRSSSVVAVIYTGWTTEGVMVDSSVTRGGPMEFDLRKVIPGWTDGICHMRVGDRARFWIDEDMTYQGRRGGPRGMLVFDIELVGIVNGESEGDRSVR